MKYKFEYGSTQETEVKVEIEEKELINLLLRGVYGMNIHLHRDYVWLYAEVYRKNSAPEERFGLAISIDEPKEIYGFLVTFLEQPNVSICTDYWFKEDSENSKLELVERCVRKDSLSGIDELKGVEGITVIEHNKKEKQEKPTQQKGKAKGTKVMDDCPF